MLSLAVLAALALSDGAGSRSVSRLMLFDPSFLPLYQVSRSYA
jgi:hypothetical protein